MTTQKRTKQQEAANDLRWMIRTGEISRYGYPQSKEELKQYKELLADADLRYYDYEKKTVLMTAAEKPKVLKDVLMRAKVEDLSMQVPLRDETEPASVIYRMITHDYRREEMLKVLLNSDVVQKNQDQLLTPEIWEEVKFLPPEECFVFSCCKGWKDEYLIYSHLRGLFPRYSGVDIPTLKEAEDFMLHSPLTQDPKMRQVARDILASVKEINLFHGNMGNRDYLRDNRTYKLEVNVKDLEYLATELCPNTEYLILPLYAPPSIDNNISIDHIQILPKFKKLKKLSMCDNLGDEAFKILGQMDSLEELDFSCGEHVWLSVEKVKALSGLPNLKEIKVNKEKCLPDEKKLERACPHLITNFRSIYFPKSERYKELKDERDQERKRILGLTTGNWKDKLYEALKKNKKWDAMEILELNGLVKTRSASDVRSYWGTDKDFYAKGTQSGIAPCSSFETKDSLSGIDILDLGNNRIAVGYIYDDSKWERKAGERAWGGGIEYTRSIDAAIIDLDKGVITNGGRSPSIRWRDRYDSSKDIPITNTDHFLKKEGSTVIAWLESNGRELVSVNMNLPESNLKKTLSKGMAEVVKATKEKPGKDK